MRPIQKPAWFDFLDWVRVCWLLSMVLLTSWPLDLHWETLGWLTRWTPWWDIVVNLHRIGVWKIWNKYWGTWESNPGPKDHQTRCQPLHQSCAFVSKMRTKYYIKRMHYMLENKKRARVIWINQPGMDTSSSSSFILQNRNKIAGVFNPHNVKLWKIAISYIWT